MSTRGERVQSAEMVTSDTFGVPPDGTVGAIAPVDDVAPGSRGCAEARLVRSYLVRR